MPITDRVGRFAQRTDHGTKRLIPDGDVQEVPAAPGVIAEQAPDAMMSERIAGEKTGTGRCLGVEGGERLVHHDPPRRTNAIPTLRAPNPRISAPDAPILWSGTSLRCSSRAGFGAPG
jgi:hypothetical protein